MTETEHEPFIRPFQVYNTYKEVIDKESKGFIGSELPKYSDLNNQKPWRAIADKINGINRLRTQGKLIW